MALEPINHKENYRPVGKYVVHSMRKNTEPCKSLTNLIT
jgi:hypothetical protein